MITNRDHEASKIKPIRIYQASHSRRGPTSNACENRNAEANPGASSPLTHAEVSEELQDLGVDKATVFRNLNDMASAGLLRRTELGDHVWRFELVAQDGGHGSAHPHFVCVDCGTVSCMDQIKLTAGSLRLSEEYGEVTEILLRGHCNDCG